MSAADGDGLRARLATQVRVTSRSLVVELGNEDLFLGIAQQIEAINNSMLVVQAADSAGGRTASVTKDPFDVLEFSTLSSLRSPVTGRYNPLAPPATVWVEVCADGQPKVLGHVTFGVIHEGIPGCVHGGMIAQLFDGVLGAANVAADCPGMTGTMSVRFHRPTPSGKELGIAALCRRREGRKIFSWAGLFVGDELTADADGLFIDVSSVGLRSIAQRNASDFEL